MCGIDGRVTKEQHESEVRSADGFGGRCTGVDSDSGVASLTAVARAAAAASTSSKVLAGSLSRSQDGLGGK